MRESQPQSIGAILNIKREIANAIRAKLGELRAPDPTSETNIIEYLKGGIVEEKLEERIGGKPKAFQLITATEEQFRSEVGPEGVRYATRLWTGRKDVRDALIEATKSTIDRIFSTSPESLLVPVNQLGQLLGVKKIPAPKKSEKEIIEDYYRSFASEAAPKPVPDEIILDKITRIVTDGIVAGFCYQKDIYRLWTATQNLVPAEQVMAPSAAASPDSGRPRFGTGSTIITVGESASPGSPTSGPAAAFPNPHAASATQATSGTSSTLPSSQTDSGRSVASSAAAAVPDTDQKTVHADSITLGAEGSLDLSAPGLPNGARDSGPAVMETKPMVPGATFAMSDTELDTSRGLGSRRASSILSPRPRPLSPGISATGAPVRRDAYRETLERGHSIRTSPPAHLEPAPVRTSSFRANGRPLTSGRGHASASRPAAALGPETSVIVTQSHSPATGTLGSEPSAVLTRGTPRPLSPSTMPQTGAAPVALGTAGSPRITRRAARVGADSGAGTSRDESSNTGTAGVIVAAELERPPSPPSSLPASPAQDGTSPVAIGGAVGLLHRMRIVNSSLLEATSPSPGTELFRSVANPRIRVTPPPILPQLPLSPTTEAAPGAAASTPPPTTAPVSIRLARSGIRRQ